VRQRVGVVSSAETYSLASQTSGSVQIGVGPDLVANGRLEPSRNLEPRLLGWPGLSTPENWTAVGLPRSTSVRAVSDQTIRSPFVLETPHGFVSFEAGVKSFAEAEEYSRRISGA
jgi:hypothetical protein